MLIKRKLRYLLKLLLKILSTIIILGIIAILCIEIHIHSVIKGGIFTEVNELPNAEAILVLGARVYKDSPSLMLSERLDVAASMFFAEKAPKIIVSGGVNGPDYNEPQIMKEYLIKHGIPEAAIILDDEGRNTFRSCYRAYHSFNYRRILIATTDYHLSRSLFLARKLGLECYGSGSADKFIYNMPYNYFRETLAKVKALYNIYISAPF